MKRGQPRPRSETLTPARIAALGYIYKRTEHYEWCHLTPSHARALVFLDGDYYECSPRTNSGRRYRLTNKGRETVEWLRAVEGARSHG